MLLTLSQRFSKHIAILLLWTFYADLVFSGRLPNSHVHERVIYWPTEPALRYAPFYIGTSKTGSGGDNKKSSTGGHQRKRAKASALQVLAQPTAPIMEGATPPLAASAPAGGGPTQPEMASYTSVNANNMVDLFSGDFSYNIPLLDVGGYPVNLAYRSGSGMEDEASWVGLGWNINPGSITRNMRGLPDDFDGGNDTVRKVQHIKDNNTIGVSVGGDLELAGLPINLGFSLGLFHNTYNGWGGETSINASLNSGAKTFGPLSAGLSLTNNSQQGVTLVPSLGASFSRSIANDKGGLSFGASFSLPYNSHTGIKALQLGLSESQFYESKMNGEYSQYGKYWAKGGSSRDWNTSISLAGPTFTPTINIPTTNKNYSFTAKLGAEAFSVHPNVFASGYWSSETVAGADTALYLPAYGYLNYQDINGNYAALADYNREKEIPYRQKPAIPHIAVPSYTYDVFTINGEGTGGMFRPYRGDIGFIADPLISNKSNSDAASIDIGLGNLYHGGVDLNVNYSHTTTGPWLDDNTLRKSIAFQKSNGLFEAAYFRNPGEKAINTKDFYDAIGGDDVVAPVLSQSGSSIVATNTLTRYSGQKVAGTVTMSPTTSIRQNRDKRTETISYLTAAQASLVGLDKTINSYAINSFTPRHCEDQPPPASPNGKGLLGYYYPNSTLSGAPTHVRLDSVVYFNWGKDGQPFNTNDGETLFMQSHTDPGFPQGNFSVRWLGELKAPVTGTYTIATFSDDGARVYLDDVPIINYWSNHPIGVASAQVNLIAGHTYNIRMEYYQAGNYAIAYLVWKLPGDLSPLDQNNHNQRIPRQYLFPPDTQDAVNVDGVISEENRVNNFRQPNHISEIDVLNPDGRRYVYGTPVYNLTQKEVSYSVSSDSGNIKTGLARFSFGYDNTTNNQNGKEGYFSKEEVPAFAHSFLLTGILSPDYVDVTGDGISDDDLGDAVKFNYSKVAGIHSPYGWRAPYISDSANYNEGFRSYDQDDKAHYIYGTKELWYLNSIESKTMIATFTLQNRSDLRGIDEMGHKDDSTHAMCLKQIDLYSKADFLAHGTSATPIKTVHFEYSYELCRGINGIINDSGKLTLKRVWFTYNGNDKGVRNPYVFNYHPNNPRYKVNSSDKWGTYKDASQNPGSTPDNPLTNAEYPYALQDSARAADNAGAWQLDSIGLPSGGKIKVNYESDDYAYIQNLRATQMCRLIGMGPSSTNINGSYLYIPSSSGSKDQLFAYIRVPCAPTSNADLLTRYLEDVTKLYFRVYLQMPSDEFGTGFDYVPGYADLDTTHGPWYGTVTGQPTVIWLKLKGINKTGDGDGTLNPIAQTAINFLRLNLPSKAYPNSEIKDQNFDIRTVVGIVQSMVANMSQVLDGYSNYARNAGWVNYFDTTRSFIRLDCPTMKKRGGGLRVKSILIYDNWSNMTGQRETIYGQTYDYTTTRNVNGVPTVISSGVAAWEPSVGAEENPFHLPIEYVDRASVLAPSATLYTETPLGEAFYPGPSVGYSRVVVHSIHGPEVKSATGYTENTFYTSCDFPTTWDYSMLDGSTEKQYKPLLNNFLRINAENFLTFSQGFKVELNDMNGKPRSTAVYAQTDSNSLISYTENFYKVDDQHAQIKHLNNIVTTIDPYGNIDTAATIGKDAELMTDMREQTSQSLGDNVNLNVDEFIVVDFPVPMPSYYLFTQKETDRFRSVAMTKVIQRYGILDSVVHIDKGSKVTTSNLAYDSETGDPLLTSTQNEFNDPVYNFNYPAHWIYDAMGSASQNIGAVLTGLTINAGRITKGLTQPDSTFLSPGDELLVYSHEIYNTQDSAESFAQPVKLWVVDSMYSYALHLLLVDQYGNPFNGANATVLVTRSGRRNTGGDVGSVTMLANPLVRDGSGVYHLAIDSTKNVLNAGAGEMQQDWAVSDKRRMVTATNCVYTIPDSATVAGEGCVCLKPLFDYLITTRQMYYNRFQQKSVRSLVTAAINAGYPVDTSHCPILTGNLSLPFYSINGAPSVFYRPSYYEAYIGNAVVTLKSNSGEYMSPYTLVSTGCDASGRVRYKDTSVVVPKLDTVTVSFHPQFSANLLSEMGACPFYLDTLLAIDTTTDHLITENSLDNRGAIQNAIALLRFDSLGNVPAGANILSAKLILQADTRGHLPPYYDSARSTNPIDTVEFGLTGYTGWFPYMSLDTLLYQAYNSPWAAGVPSRTPFQNDTMDVSSYLALYYGNRPSYYSSTFVLTQGSGHQWAGPGSDTMPRVPASGGVPGFFLAGYNNYYATWYNQHYADTSMWPVIRITYVTPAGMVDTFGATLSYSALTSCNNVLVKSCYSDITDTIVNPYQFGILGNFRPAMTYVYYGRRRESDPTKGTNTRTDGTISGFMPFWTLQNGNWLPSYDPSRWVWNTQSTLYNRKGFELENRDPLGRFNSGIYGYGETLPVAVTQNGRYQETAAEGFEDYGFPVNSCDNSCPVGRPFDFSAYNSSMVTNESHTGLYSLRILPGSNASISATVDTPAGVSFPQLTDTLGPSPNFSFAGQKATGNAVLPSFSPYAGTRIEVGAWVKEADSCSCHAYTGDHLQLSFTVGGVTSGVQLSPRGNVIEGWQRYDTLLDIPSGATALTLTLSASPTDTTYFDDIRIEPFNAEMKTYVYNPVNLRLMAELDENNYATFYEYDDDGTLIRVKKETERGILTIKETRSSLTKIKQ